MPSRRVARTLPPIALAALIAARCAQPTAPGPFYRAPSGHGAGRPGHVIRSEPLAGAPPGSRAWKILYVSTGFDGKPVEVSGVIVAPTLPPPAGGRPVVAWAHPTTGVSDRCAPSNWPTFFDTIPHLPALVALDCVVAATDYEGLGTPGPHPYLVGRSEALSVLDSVRAAREIEKAAAGTRFVVWGHSQGGHAALFTGQLARDYAPDLTLMGVAAIAPATELATLLRADLVERAGRILGAYCLWSWSRVYGAPIDRIVETSSVAVIDRVAADCLESDEEGYVAAFDSLTLRSDFVESGAYEAEPWKSLMEENRPGRSPIGAPIYIAQGTDDPIVRPAVTADFVQGLCGRGEAVRFEKLEGVGHTKAARVSASSAIGWMADRFEGRRAPNTCSRDW